MISADTHIIRRQVMDITYTGNPDNGAYVQQKVLALCTDQLIPVIEKTLDRYAHNNGHLYIDLLEIELGEFQSDELEWRLSEALTEKLDIVMNQPSIQKWIYAEKQDVHQASEKVRILNDITSFSEALIYFLQTGQLPWNYKLSPGKSMADGIRELINLQELDIIIPGITEVLHADNARRRFVYQFDLHIVLDVLRFISPALKHETQKLLSIFPQARFPSFTEKILESALSAAISGRPTLQAADIVEGALQLSLSGIHPMATPDLQQLISVAKIHLPEFRQATRIKSEFREDTSSLPHPSHPYAIADTPGWYVENAGFILLHPFLSRLFEATGLLEDNRITDPNRAVLLLHYLCTGRVEAPEYELTFFKIICGIPTDEPVPYHIELRPSDIEEADALLDVVVRYWTALHNTSRDGLRGTFLLRSGKISISYDGHWLLQVERHSVDILLDAIPWGFGIVKLPWLEKLIHVEW